MQYSTFDEKIGVRYSAANEQSATHRLRQPARRKLALLTAICVVTAAAFRCWDIIPVFAGDALSNGLHGLAPSETQDDSVFTWHSIVPSPELVYHKCYEDYQCARLEVPMDWLRTDGKGNKVAIAIIRLPAKVAVSDPRYAGVVLTNPGGPGGSGIEQALRSGKATQVIVDSEVDPNSTALDPAHKYHDIISFDPRGIGRTTPGIQCFPDSLSREAWGMQNEALGLLGSSEDSFLRNWYRSKALAEGCSTAIGTTLDGSEPIGEHVNTSPVARDMLEIAERHAQWVEEQGRLAQDAHDMTYGYDKTQSIVERTRWSKGEEKLKYWGNSYGTILGQSFASMFPDRVDRLILDGVCDSHDYFFGSWFSNLKDADQIMDKFFLYCFEAGPSECSFYGSGGPEAMREAYDNLLQDVFLHPRAVPSSPTRGPDVITWSDVKSMVRLGMYQPLMYMPMVADLLTDISVGNGSLFADFKHMEHTPSCPTAACKIAGPYSQECNADGDNGEDAQMAILCADGEGLGQVDESQFQQYWHALQNQSHVMGDFWAHTRLSCVGWKAKAKWRFPGPFTGNTSHPLLFIGTTLDPVTPLDNARRMSLNFPGSAVLQQDSAGHTSWSSPSLCTAKVAREYFQTGSLPDLGTVCNVDRVPFQVPQAGISQMSASDAALFDALKVMQESYMKLKLRSRSIGF